jgi:hypothetical protein
MKVAIMQPTYIPWVGYFALIKKVDIFVFLDDVKIEKSDWQVRNKILVQGRELFLSIPVIGGRKQLICNVKTDTSQNWRQKHIRTLTQSYSRHHYVEDALDILASPVFDNGISLLAGLTTCIIMQLAGKLKINTKFLFSSDLNVNGKKSRKLINILEKIGGDHYVSPIGSKEYIEQEAVFSSCGIQLEYHDYTPMPYPQINSREFVPFLSVVDLIANVGYEAADEYI